MIVTLFDAHTVTIDDEALLYGGAWHPNGDAHSPALLQACGRYLATLERPVALDIGASTGSLALLAALYPALTVHAFEPVDAVRSVLKRNLALNEIEHQVYVSPNAVGAQGGVATFYVVEPDAMIALSMLGGNPHHSKWHRATQVSVTTVDAYVALHSIPRVDLLKVDVEGGELYVLEGARETLHRDHPAVVVEANWQNVNQYGYTPERLAAELHGYGYTTCLHGEDLLTEALCAVYQGEQA